MNKDNLSKLIQRYQECKMKRLELNIELNKIEKEMEILSREIYKNYDINNINLIDDDVLLNTTDEQRMKMLFVFKEYFRNIINNTV